MKSKKIKKPKKKTFLFLPLLLLFTIHCLLFTNAHALDVKRIVLDNGLILLIVERHNLPVVNVNVGINAGSLIEPVDKAGLANLTAELLTAGTKSRTASEISEELDFVGASLVASGGDDYITVMLSVLKKDLDLGFELLSDIILNPVFPQDEIDKKIMRIKGSLKAMEEDPGFIASREFKKAVFGDHPYGRLILGSPESLGRINKGDIVNFHATYYLPNNSIMSVVGDITVEEVRRLIKEYLSDWKAKRLEIRIPQRPEVIKHKRVLSIDRDITQANIIVGHQGISRDNPDYYAVSVMNYILGGGGFASRLMQNLREEKGLVYDVYSFFSADKYGGLFQISLQTKNESANMAIEEVLKEIRRIRDTPVSDTELSDAKSFLTGSFPLRIETGARIARFLVAVEYYGLGIDYIEKYPVYINSVTKEDVLRVARRYLDPDNLVLVVVADEEKASIEMKDIK